MIDKSILLDAVRQLTNEDGVRHGVDVYFHSPLHNEHTPSFKVNTNLHKWHDFGTSQHGDVIDLIRLLNHCDYKAACLFLSQGNFCGYVMKESLGKEKEIDVKEITTSSLIEYATQRSVAINVLRTYCKEIHQGNYYYIGFPSANGGWELRNPFFKGCIGRKSYSHIAMGSDKVMIFEGFFDFLSFRSSCDNPFDAIILNTTAMVNAIIPLLSQYRCVHTYLDNDQGGRSATEFLMRFRADLTDHSPNFAPYNDVNDFISAKSHVL